MLQRAMQETIRSIVTQLVAGDYAGLEQRTCGVRLSASEIREAVHDYGRRLEMPPAHAFEDLDVVQVWNVEPRKWSVVCPLWTAEDGRSDLSLELTLVEQETGFRIELDDIRVR